ncbi:MAG TPA: PAS domain S-box protein [Bacteroidales bacterium]|jgi:PAS domain S-box-containing protein|nr:PAS domain S-box protein [Bacteroidales bacterium]
MFDSDDLLNAVMENIFDPVFVKDTEGRIRLCNAAFERFAGKPSAELIGKTDEYYLNDPGLYAQVRSNDLEVINSREGKIFEEVILTASGPRIFISNKSPLFDKKGNLTGVLGIAHDITERKKAEDALAQKEKEYREIIKYAPTGIYEIDYTSKKFISVNESMIRLSGYSREELLEMDILYLLEPGSRKKFTERISRIQKGEKEAESITYKIIRKDGSVIHVLLNVNFRCDSSGRPVGALVIGHDITERVKVEEEREKLINELKTLKEKLDLALESGNIGIWQWDIESNLLLFDERTEKIFGLAPGTFRKSFNGFLELVNEEDLAQVRKIVAGSTEKRTTIETVFRTKPGIGKVRRVSTKGIVEKDERGRVINMVGVCIDVTGLLEHTESLIARLNEELLRSNRELQNFAYIASHDLQEPLRMVTSFTQLLSMQYHDKLDDTAHEYINYAVNGAKRMYNLLNDLLAYSRMQTRPSEVTVVNLDTVMDNVLKNLALAIKEKSAEIKTEKPLPRVYAEYGQMIVLFQNLISNGLKFSKENPKIYVSCKKIRGEYVISIKDEGIGIEKQYYNKIFQIFQRLNPKKDYEGTGIGLALCKRIVENHGGRIWVESEPGKGSEFFFTIPVRR